MNFRCPLQHELLTGVVKWPQWSLAGFPRSSPGPSLRPCLPDFLCTWLPVSFSQWEDWSVGRRDKPSVSVSRCCFKRWPHTYWLNDVFITFQFWRSKVWNKSYGAKSRRRAALLLDALGEAASFPVAATFLGCDHITLTCLLVVTLPSLTLTLDSLL